MIDVRGLCKRYGEQDGYAVEDIHMKVEKGTIHGLIGHNGSGKTTIIKCLTGIFPADRGEVLVDGKDVYNSVSAKSEIGYVADTNQMFRGYRMKKMAQFYEDVYSDFSMEDFNHLCQLFLVDKNKKVSQMSKGQQMKASFVLNMARRPKVLILDEPTAGLDVMAKKELLDSLVCAVENNDMTVLISSHHLSELERICDTVTVINQGKVQIEDTLEDVTSQTVKYQLVFKSGAPSELYNRADICHMSNVGSVYTVVLESGDDTFAEQMKALGAALVEECGGLGRKFYLYESEKKRTGGTGMNRKKALYQYELATMKWFLAAGLLCALLVLFILNAIYRSELPMDYESMNFLFDDSYSCYSSFTKILVDKLSFLIPMALVAVAFMTIIQFSDYHKRNRREYITSLPFTQRERFAAKYLVGAGILTIVTALFGAGVFVLRSMYFELLIKCNLIYPEYPIIYGNDTWFHTLRSILVLWLVILAAYSVFTMIHSVITRGIVASLVSLGIIIAPAYLMYMSTFYIYSFCEEYFVNQQVNEHMWMYTIKQVCCSFIGSGFYKEELLLQNDKMINYIDYGNVGVVLLVLLLVLIGCTAGAYMMNGRQDGAKFGMIIPIKWIRMVISMGAAFCFAFPLALFAAFCTGVDNNVVFVVLVHVVICVALTVITQKIGKRLNR